MSTLTLVQEKLGDGDGVLSSTAPTPGRNSAEILNTEDKLEEQNGSDELEPEPMSKTRTSLLLMGLTLSIFLVALDFVLSPEGIRLLPEYHYNRHPENHR
jgi:hypothetical protein